MNRVDIHVGAEKETEMRFQWAKKRGEAITCLRARGCV